MQAYDSKARERYCHLEAERQTVSHEHGSLLGMQMRQRIPLLGYPNTLIGKLLGSRSRIRVDETYVALKGDFDAYAVFEDEKHLIEYAGFSGSRYMPITTR